MVRIRIGVAFLALGVTVGCDQIESLRVRLLGSGTSESLESPEITEAKALYEAGQVQDALQRFEQITSADPTSEQGFYYLGLCCLSAAGEKVDSRAPFTELEQKSRDAFERALALNPRYTEAAIGMGDLYFRRAKQRPRRNRNLESSEDPFQIALEAYERAIEIDPKHPDAQLHYALFLDRAGRGEDAERAHKAAVEAAATIPELAPDYYVAYGRFLAARRGRLQEAVDQYELARMFRQDDLEIQREIAIVHGRIGQGYFENEQYSLAEQSLSMAYGMFPDKNDAEAQKVAETLNELRGIRVR
jgi:tetratricopeptide (TPR) repeat protein